MVLLKIFTMIEMNVEAVAFALTCKIIHTYISYMFSTDRPLLYVHIIHLAEFYDYSGTSE